MCKLPNVSNRRFMSVTSKRKNGIFPDLKVVKNMLLSLG